MAPLTTLELFPAPGTCIGHWRGMFAPSVGAGVRRAPFAGVQPRRVPAGPALAASGSRRVVARANPDDKQVSVVQEPAERLRGGGVRPRLRRWQASLQRGPADLVTSASLF